MGNVGTSAVRIIDDDNDVVTVTNNRLDVNATVGVGSSTLITTPQDTATATAQTVTTLIGGQITTCKEIIIQADFDNASFIMVGDGDVSGDDTEGIRLHAGDMLVLPVSSTDNISIRAGDTSQKFNFSIIT